MFFKDNGRGIASAHHDQAFSLFTRLVTNSEQPGIVLELSMARQIMRQVGGELSIEHSNPEGTTFKLSYMKRITKDAGDSSTGDAPNSAGRR